MNTGLRIITVAALGLGLAGCSMAPDYVRPEIGDLPAQYDGALAAAVESRPVEAPGWWEDFGSTELNGYVTEALAANTDLEAAAARVLEARALFVGQRSNQLPSAEVGGTVTRSKRSLAGFGQPLSIYSTIWDVSAQAAWELDIWGRLSQTRRAAWTNLLAGEADRRAVRQGLIANVVRSWLDAKRQQEQYELTARTLETYRDNLTMVEDRYASGVRSSLDVHQARQNVAAAEASLAVVEQGLRAARRQLELLLGRYPAGVIGVGETPLADMAPLPELPLGLPADLLERRPDVAAAEMRLLGAHANEGAARADLFPRLTLSGSAGWSTPDEGDLFTDLASVWSLAGNLAMPLLNRGARKAQVGATEARREQAAAQYVGVVLGAFRDVEAALDAHRFQQRRREALRASVLHAARSNEVAEERYRQGVTTYLQVLDSQRLLLQSQSDLLQTEQAWRSARVDLIQALGGRWDETDNTTIAADDASSAMR